MAPSGDTVDHGRASKVLGGVLFAKDDDADDVGISTQHLPSDDEARGPATDGDLVKQVVNGTTVEPNEQQEEENKENIAPEDQDEIQQTSDNSLKGRVQVRGEDKPKKKKKTRSGRTKGAKKRGTGFEGKASVSTKPG